MTTPLRARLGTFPTTQIIFPKPLKLHRILGLRHPVLCAGLRDEGGQSENATTEAAFHIAENMMKLFVDGEGDGIVEYLPDEVIDSALERKRSKLGDSDATLSDVSLRELLELAPSSNFSADAYAMRGIVLSKPASAAPLSTLRISSTRCMQRYNVVTASGEEMTLVLCLDLAEALEPKYRSLRVVSRWFLRSIRGEALGETPVAPDRLHGPESVVQAQLNALKIEDVAGVLRFASPKNKAAYNGNVEVFSEMLRSETYSPLLSFASGEVLRCTQLSAERAFAVVGITQNPKGVGTSENYVFGWALSLQDSTVAELEGCWLTDSVYPLGGGGFYVA